MRLRGSADSLEDRRRRALALGDEGLSLHEVGRRIVRSASSVKRWRDARWRGGQKALMVRFPPSCPPRLSRVEGRRLVSVLLKGALAASYANRLWTTARVAEVISKKFRVHYHRDHVGRLLHALDWSHQKPQKQAPWRNKADTRRFIREDWSRVVTKPSGWAPTSSSPTNRVLPASLRSSLVAAGYAAVVSASSVSR
jgi:putative transposase